MRKIKFRVWNKKSAKYESGVYINENGSIFIDNIYDLIQLEGDNWIVQQFTGLTDKAGKEIYEGDIIKYSGKIYNVAFTDECHGGKSGWDLLDKDRICHQFYYGGFEAFWSEVIGNINENPDLI